jgi:hypothetical protein
MGLSPDKIKALLAKPDRKPRQKKGPDTSIREVANWFKLAPKMIDENTHQQLRCENPNCLDNRPFIITATGDQIRSQFCIRVNGVLMCRRCFLGGWLLDDPDQLKL